jgi:hypothetical protein
MTATSSPAPKTPSWSSKMLPWLGKGAAAAIGVLFAASLAAFFTYLQWTTEEKVSREKQDYDRINTAATEVAGALSAVMTLQINLFFTERDAEKVKSDVNMLAFDQKNAQDINAEYAKAWTSLKNQILLLLWKTDLDIDRIANLSNDSSNPDLLNQLENTDFSCETTLPPDSLSQQNSQTPLKIGGKVSNLKIDWTRASDNVATFYYCMLHVHDQMELIMEWAISATPSSLPQLPQPVLCGTQSQKELLVECDLDNHQDRLEGLLSSVACALDQVRTHYGQPNIWQYIWQHISFGIFSSSPKETTAAEPAGSQTCLSSAKAASPTASRQSSAPP